MFYGMTLPIASHDWGLVGLAGAISFFVIAVAISIYHRAQLTSGRERFVWLALDAAASGYGLWASNFVSILSYGRPLEASYNLTLALISLIFAISFIGGGLFIAGRDYSNYTAVLGGVVVGIGIAAMHLAAIQALQPPGHIVWSAMEVTAGIAFGIVFGGISFFIAIRRNNWSHLLTGATLATCSVLCTHFMIISGLKFVPDSKVVLDQELSEEAFALVIAASAIFILAMYLAVALSDSNSKEKLRKQKILLDAAIDNMSQGLLMCDVNGKILLFNERYLKILGLPAHEVQGQSLTTILKRLKAEGRFAADPKEVLKEAAKRLSQGLMTHEYFEAADGRVLRITDQPMADGGRVTTFEDITEARNAQAQISHMARHDSLTDLPNRRLFHEQLEQALLHAAREAQIAVLCLDLDHFKDVNDSLGHPIGDALLKEVAQRLKACIRDCDTVARLGGDEFAIIQVADEPNATHAAALASRLVEVIAAAYEIQGHRINIGTSIGISVAPNDGNDPDQLLKNADMALYLAKSDGRSTYRFFEPGMDARAQARRILELDLRGALTREEFEVHYQPIHDLRSDRIICFEALVRWNHPLRGMIQPGAFLGLAEETGLIIQIGDFVLRRACQDAARWPQEVSVAVNLSPIQFKNRNLVSSIFSALSDAGLAPNRLELEITESVLLQDSDATLDVLHKLREHGVRIAMDDFGTGYSSLSYLRSFPFDKIKIDQSFIRDLALKGDSMAIVRAVTSLGKSLGIVTTAEGVETSEQLALLGLEGCNSVQGFYFSAARPAADVEKMLSKDALRGVA